MIDCLIEFVFLKGRRNTSCQLWCADIMVCWALLVLLLLFLLLLVLLFFLLLCLFSFLVVFLLLFFRSLLLSLPFFEWQKMSEKISVETLHTSTLEHTVGIPLLWTHPAPVFDGPSRFLLDGLIVNSSFPGSESL